VISVIDPSRYEVIPVGITSDGQWVAETAERDDLPAGTLPSVRSDRPAFSWDRIRDEVDVVFPLLHGPWGEDGTIQGLLEMADVPYVGAGVLASAVAMDKPFAKTVFSAAGLPQLPYVTVLPWEWKSKRDRAIARIRALGLPVFVKPARAGSSSGVTMVTDWSSLEDAIEVARELDPKVIVEAAANGKREVECAVIQDENGRPIVSEVGEIVVDAAASHDYYDFEAKYLDGSSRNVIPAEIGPQTRSRLQAYALQAFEAIACEGLARVDFFLTDSVDGGLVINEVNTMPGFTPFSMFPKAWEATGISYAELIERLLRLAVARGTGLR